MPNHTIIAVTKSFLFSIKRFRKVNFQIMSFLSQKRLSCCLPLNCRRKVEDYVRLLLGTY